MMNKVTTKFHTTDKTNVIDGDVAIVTFRTPLLDKQGTKVMRFNVGEGAKEILVDEPYDREVTTSGQYDFFFWMWPYEWYDILVYRKI